MKKLTIFALALSIIASCSKEDSVAINGNDSNVVSFSAGDISRVTSAEAALWAAGDAVGISTTGFDGVNGATEFTNVKYVSTLGTGDLLETTTATSTAFSCSATSPILYPNTSAGSVVFSAYYPYDADYGTNSYITVDVSEQEKNGYGSVDFMTAKTSSIAYGYSYDNDAIDGNGNATAVAFSFTHKLAKVVISVSLNDNLSSLDRLTTSISDIYSIVGYDIAGAVYVGDNPLTATTDDFDLTTEVESTNKKTATVTAILHPMAVDDCEDAEITFEVANREFTVGFNVALTAGSQHNYSIELGNDYPQFTGNSIITGWNGINTTATPLVPTETTSED